MQKYRTIELSGYWAVQLSICTRSCIVKEIYHIPEYGILILFLVKYMIIIMHE